MRTEHRRDHFEDYTLITVIASIILLFAGIVSNITFIRTNNYDNYKTENFSRRNPMPHPHSSSRYENQKNNPNEFDE